MKRDNTRRSLYWPMMATVLLNLALATALMPTVSVEAGTRKPATFVIGQGKLFCPTRRYVVMPYAGTVISLAVRLGQAVKKGEVLFRYSLDKWEVLSLQKRFSRFPIPDLEIKLIEIEETLGGLRDRKTELEQLSEKQLAPRKSLEKLALKIRFANQKRELILKRLESEKKLAAAERHALGLELGFEGTMRRIPNEGLLRAPMDGYVIVLSPELRRGAMIAKDIPVVQIGTMNPMVMRAQVHEIEVAKLTFGQSVEVTMESVPGRIFPATIQRIPWAPLRTSLEKPTYYEIELLVPNPDLLLKAGYKGEIRVSVPLKNSAE